MKTGDFLGMIRGGLPAWSLRHMPVVSHCDLVPLPPLLKMSLEVLCMATGGERAESSVQALKTVTSWCSLLVKVHHIAYGLHVSLTDSCQLMCHT